MAPRSKREKIYDLMRDYVEAIHVACERWLTDTSLSDKLTLRRLPAAASPWRKMMTATKPDASGRTPQDKIDAIHRPKWCVSCADGRLYWDLIGAAIRDDAETIREHLRQDPDCARLEFWYTPPLHFAVREGNLDATRVLWEAHAHQEVTDLIAMADDRGHADVAAYLRDSIGAAAVDSDLRLHEAVEAGDHGEIAAMLRGRGAV
jgi:hypothetical protein